MNVGVSNGSLRVDLGEMERHLALFGCHAKSLSHNLDGGVVGEFEIVDTGHD